MIKIKAASNSDIMQHLYYIVETRWLHTSYVTVHQVPAVSARVQSLTRAVRQSP